MNMDQDLLKNNSQTSKQTNIEANKQKQQQRQQQQKTRRNNHNSYY